MKEDNIVIKLDDVSKTFFIREKGDYSIRERVYNLFHSSSGMRKIEAVKHVSMEVKKGDFIGIIGHNGSGKSTLLRLILGAIKPDREGSIETKGKILRLSLGLGFDPNLSARHNIYVNGSIMGLTFKEIGEKFHEIIDFADLEEFIDTPLRFFSSGMYSRLAFSIAMHAKADILLIDEFFGTVGDEAFREKSRRYFEKYIQSNKTVLFVSHHLELVERFCSTVYVMEKGEVIKQGPPEETIDAYKNSYHLHD